MGVMGPKKETEKGIKDLKDKIKILLNLNQQLKII